MPVVIGANGFLGSYIVSALLKKGYKVKACKRNNSSLKEFEEITYRILGDRKKEYLDNLTWLDADITDILSLDAAVAGEEIVFHCAAKVAFKGQSSELIKTNVEGTANVVNACLNANVRKLCYISSTAALGRTDDEKVINEETSWIDDDNNTAYAVSKHNAELEVWRGVEEGLDAVILNPGIIIGAGDWNKGSAGIIHSVYKGLKFYTQGINGFVGPEDVADIACRLTYSDVKNERFILVSENYSYAELLRTIAKELGMKAPRILIKPSYLSWVKIVFWFNSLLRPSSNLSVETLKTSVKKFHYSSAKIKALGYSFTPIAETIQQTVKFFKQNIIRK